MLKMVSRARQFLKNVSILVSSIRFRLALWFVLILGVVMAIFCAFIYTRQVQDLRNSAVARLELADRRIGGFLRFAGIAFFNQPPTHFPIDPNSGEALLQGNDLLAFLTPDGQVIRNWGASNVDTMRQLSQAAIKSEDPNNGYSDVLFSTKISGEAYYFMLAPISVGNQLAGFFLLGTPVDPDGQLHRLLFSLILGMLGTLAIAMVGGFWLADRAIHPVKQITQTARMIGETDLSQRLHLEQKDELGELADTFDDMLDRLQAAFERQRQFTADASHELRTPLTIVELEASRALAASRSPQEYIRTLRVIQSENQFMTRMVSNLLTLARMDAGQVVLNKQEVDLSDVVLEVVERLAPLAKKSQVKLTAGDLPELPILGDRQFLSQMISNLVDNAIKYSYGEDKCVEVMTGASHQRYGNRAWVRVIDNGPGIPAEHLPHLFDRFYQVDKARSKQDQDLDTQSGQMPSGTGLGLSIAQWIAKAHGGEIRVQSELGKGTTFEVNLPLLESSPSE